MLNKLIEYFFPKIDWKVVEANHGEWDVTVSTDFGKYQERRVAIYEIYYSESKKEYKLELSGYKPKEHRWYKHMVERTNQLQNESKIIKETP